MEDEEVAKMDLLFRQMNFAAENAGLKERIWSRISARMNASEEDDDHPLSDTELSLLAAANGRKRGEDAVREILKSIDMKP